MADGASGSGEVLNYLPYDSKGVPPAITLSASFPLSPAQVDENKSVAVSALTTDDVQVRNVEFYIDDVEVATDGNYPFNIISSHRRSPHPKLRSGCAPKPPTPAAILP